MKIQTWILLIFAMALSGCAPKYSYHSYAKNYKLNEIKTARIGEPIIKVSDSYCSQKSAVFATPLENFTLESKFKRYGVMQEKFNMNAYKDMKYPIAFTVKDNETVYNVVLVNEKNGEQYYGILVDNLGNISTTKYYLVGTGIMPIDEVKINPDKSMFSVRNSTSCEVTLSGGLNYELLYTGVSDSLMYLTYRELPPQNQTRPTFYQNLSRPKTEKRIIFNAFKIDVIALDNEKINYKVTEDELIDEVVKISNLPRYIYRISGIQ